MGVDAKAEAPIGPMPYGSASDESGVDAKAEPPISVIVVLLRSALSRPECAKACPGISRDVEKELLSTVIVRRSALPLCPSQ